MILSVVIVSWNTKKLLIECLDSVLKSVINIESEIIVIDNASVDSSVDYLRSLKDKITYIQNKNNPGYAPAANQGMQAAKGKYVLLLGSDTIVNTKAMELCISHLNENPDTGACACKLLNPDGSLQNSVKKFPSLKNGFFTYFSLNKLNKDYDMVWFRYDRDSEVDQIATTFLMIRTDILKKIEYFDESYKILYNDVDLCIKIKKSGHKIIFLSGASIVHYGSQSTKQADINLRKIMYEDIFRYYKRNFGLPAYFLLPVLYLRLFVIKVVR